MPKCGHCGLRLSTEEIAAHYGVMPGGREKRLVAGATLPVLPRDADRGARGRLPSPNPDRPVDPSREAELDRQAAIRENEERASRVVFGVDGEEVLREVDSRKPKASKATGKKKIARVESDPDETRGRWNKFGESPRPTGKPYKKDY